VTCPPKYRSCEGRLRQAAVAIVAGAVLAASCDRDARDAPKPAAQPAAAAGAPAQAGAAVPHGDHNPKYGGVVLMNGDLHFEAVLSRDGRHRVYFSDAVRSELPAATASGVSVTVTQKGQPPETVALQIDDSGESWVGQGRRVEDPAASARVAYTAYGKPYFIDVPFPR
jgi:hypothetical protein